MTDYKKLQDKVKNFSAEFVNVDFESMVQFSENTTRILNLFEMRMEDVAKMFLIDLEPDKKSEPELNLRILMEKIDAIETELRSQREEFENQNQEQAIQNLEDRIDTLESDYGKCAEDIDDLEDDCRNANSNVEDIANRLEDLVPQIESFKIYTDALSTFANALKPDSIATK